MAEIQGQYAFEVTTCLVRAVASTVSSRSCEPSLGVLRQSRNLVAGETRPEGAKVMEVEAVAVPNSTPEKR